MMSGPGDTISVAADTLLLPASQNEFSLGRIIPLIHPADSLKVMAAGPEMSGTVYISPAGRVDGLPIPPETFNQDFCFIILSFSLLIITVLTVSGRKSIVSGLSAIGFRKKQDLIPPGTSAVLAWPHVLRNFFTILNISLFAAVSLLSSGLLPDKGDKGFIGLTALLGGSFLAALLTRHLTCIIVAGITGWRSLFREYMVVVYNIWFAGAILLFFLNGIIIFAPLNNTLSFVTAGLIPIVILLILRTLRLLIIFHNRHISLFYFILYLCALEVLPVLVFLKILGIF
jgi:hypothetical protein